LPLAIKDNTFVEGMVEGTVVVAESILAAAVCATNDEGAAWKSSSGNSTSKKLVMTTVSGRDGLVGTQYGRELGLAYCPMHSARCPPNGTE
jgi:hypothetical protein